MRRLSNIIYAAFVVLAIHACSDPDLEEGKLVRHSFTVSVAENGIFDVFDLPLNRDLAVSGASESLEIKKGTVNGDVIEADGYYAAYPADAVKFFNPDGLSSVNMTLPVLQTAEPGSIPHGTELAVASASDDRSFILENMLGYLRFTLTDEVGKIKSVTVISADGSRISGDFSVDCLDDYLEVFPMPSSASNVSLKPSGEFFEPGEYHIAVFPTLLQSDFYLIFENESGQLAKLNFSFEGVYPDGYVKDLGSFRLLDYQYKDFYPFYSTFISSGSSAIQRKVDFATDHEFNLEVAEGQEWIHVLMTRSLDRYSFLLQLDANQGPARYGTIVAESTDGSARIVYTVYQDADILYQPSDIRAALIDIYNSTNGPQWRRNDNWCTDLPLSEWYGLSVTYPDDSEKEVVTLINLANNNLSGPLPASVGALSEVRSVRLNGNHISGTLPKEIYKSMSVYLQDNDLETLEEPDSPSDVRTMHLYLSGNKLSGPLPDFIGEAPVLRYINLSDNLFTGSVPSSYAKLMSSGVNLSLDNNNLSGRIPEIISGTDWFEYNWMNLLRQNGEGFDISDLRLRAPVIYHEAIKSGNSWNVNDATYYAIDVYSKNRYTVIYYGWQNEDTPNTELVSWFDTYHDSGLEVISCIPSSSCYLYEEYGLEWIKAYNLMDMRRVSISMPFLPWMGLVDSDGYYVVDPVTGSQDEIFGILEEEFGELSVPPSQDPPDPEPEFHTLQSASEGNGIDLVLMGDSYSLEEIQNGTYETSMRKAMDYFFAIEPFKSYRHLFNVYMVTLYTPLGCQYGEGNSITGPDETVFEYAGMALSDERLNEALAIVIVNSSEFGGSCYMYPSVENIPASGKSVAYIPDVELKLTFQGLIQHEACGHGFAKLADEYYDPSDPSVSYENVERIQEGEKYGWWGNVDLTSDPSEVKWAHFLDDPRYADEGLGLYEGALSMSAGIWRASYGSIMKDNSGTFNAPSREIIWRRIHRLAYGDSWKYDYDDFADYDRINRKPEEW